MWFLLSRSKIDFGIQFCGGGLIRTSLGEPPNQQKSMLFPCRASRQLISKIPFDFGARSGVPY